MNTTPERIAIADTITKFIYIIKPASDRNANFVMLTEPAKIATRITDRIIASIHNPLPTQKRLVIAEQHFVDFENIVLAVCDEILYNHIKLAAAGEGEVRPLE